MAELITFNGTDISDEVGVNEATHDMYAGGRPDTLRITFDDEEQLWAKWQPRVGDIITYRNGGTATGKMYVYDIEYRGEETTIRATTVPPELRVIYSKSWEEVYLSQIVSEISENYQLNGVDDVWYRHKACHTSKVYFLELLAQMESAALIIYDGKTMLVNESALEYQDALFEVDDTGSKISINDSSATKYDACVVQCGEYFGSFRCGNGNRLYRPDINYPCSSDAEATRYAKALLRMANKQKTEIRLQGGFIPEMSAGVCLNFNSERFTNYSGKMFAYHVRHEYHKEQSTIFMRKPLEGY
jgi:hypothetical protein